MGKHKNPGIGGGRRYWTAEEALLSRRLITESGCWEWTGARSRGYGLLAVNYRRWKAHRLSWELFRGPIPDDLTIDHLCRNKACFNPDHLEPVTQAENLRRGDTIPARNALKTHCPQGHPYSVLT